MYFICSRLILINQINCFKWCSYQWRITCMQNAFFCLSFGSLTICRLFSVFYILICQEMSNPSNKFQTKALSCLLKRHYNIFLFCIITPFEKALLHLFKRPYYVFLKGVIIPFHFELVRLSKRCYYAFLSLLCVITLLERRYNNAF